MNVSIVIPNYNGLELLKENLPKVLKAGKEAQVIVVDDASTDGSVDYLRKNFPNISLIEKVTNSGFATGVNLGVKAANGDILVLLNTDVIPEPGFIKPLIEHFRDDKVFAVGCLDLSIEGNRTVKRGRGIGTFVRGFLVHGRGEIDRDNTLWVNGGSAAYRKSIWEKLNGMDTIYDPFYWDDIDLSYRALKSGYKLVFESKSVVTHNHEGGSVKSHFKSDEIKQIVYRNQFIFVWKNITSPKYLFQHFLRLPYHIVLRIFQGDFVFVKGFCAALLKLPELLRKRPYVVKLFVKSDEEILAPFSL